MNDRNYSAPGTRPLIGVTGPDRGGAAAFLFTRLAIALEGGRAVNLTPSHPHHSVIDERARGQIIESAQLVAKHGAKILKGPYDRSDGRSVYFKDPCGMVGEYLYYRAKNSSGPS